MSTILKALRRIENEKRAQVETGLREAVATPDDSAVAAGGRRRNWLLGAVSGALVLCLGWIGYSLVSVDGVEEAPAQLAAVSTPAIPEPPDVARSTLEAEREDRPPLGTPRPGIQADTAPANPVVRPEYRALPLPPEPAVVAARAEPPKPPAPAPVAAKTAPTPRPPPRVDKPLSATAQKPRADVAPAKSVTTPPVVASAESATPPKPRAKPPAVVAAAKSVTPPATTESKSAAKPPAATSPATPPAAKRPSVATLPAAKSPPSNSAVQRAAPEFAVLGTVWHPVADRRKVILEMQPGDERVELQEGDELGSLRVSEIKPASVVFDQGGKTITRAIGSK